MDARRLFQLGTTDLGSGAAQTEGYSGTCANDNHSRDARFEFRSIDDAVCAEALADVDLRGNTEQDHFIRRDGVVFAGTHLILEVVDGEGLDDKERIEGALRDCVDECGATLLHIHLHRFSPQGVSGVAVLAESHISVHTWPERGYGAFDVFMCGDAEPHRAIDVLRRSFNARELQVTELLRGAGLLGA